MGIVNVMFDGFHQLRLQHGVDDQSKLKSVAPTIGKLEDLQERMKDDYSANKALRDIFRVRLKFCNIDFYLNITSILGFTLDEKERNQG